MRKVYRFAMILLVLPVLLFGAFQFQISQSHAQQDVRPAQEMLNWGDSYFGYPDWLATITESANETRGIWTQAYAAVSRRIVSGYKPLDGKALAKLIDDKYIQGTMVEYGDYEVTNRCINDKYVILDINATAQHDTTTKYHVRQWIWSDKSGWTDIFTAVQTNITKNYSKKNAADTAKVIDQLAEDSFGDAKECSQ